MKINILTPKLNIRNSPCLKNKNFIYFLIGVTISSLGDKIYEIAFPWIVYDICKSSLIMGKVRMIQLVPSLLIGFFMGAIIDKVNRKRLLFLSVLGQIICMLLLFVMVWFNKLSLTGIYGLSFTVSGLAFIFIVTQQSSMHLIIRKEDLLEANTNISFFRNLISILGPALVGILISSIKLQGMVIFNLITFGILVLCIVPINFAPQDSDIKKDSRFFVQISEGWQYIKKDKIISSSIFMITIMNIGMVAFATLILFHIRNNLQFTSNQVGWFYTLGAIGTVLAPILSKIMSQEVTKGKLICNAALIVGLSVFSFSLLENFFILGMIYGISSGAVTIVNIHVTTIIQKNSEESHIGRIMTNALTIVKITAPIAAFLAGYLAELLNSSLVIRGSSMIVILGALYSFYTPLRKAN